MFKSYEHFKKTTQSLFVEIQNNKINKLSDLRNSIVEKAGFLNIQSFKNTFNNISDNNQESVSVICVKDGFVIEKVDILGTGLDSLSQAQKVFFDMLEQYSSNFDEYTVTDFEALLEQGYEKVGDKIIQIFINE